MKRNFIWVLFVFCCVTSSAYGLGGQPLTTDTMVFLPKKSSIKLIPVGSDVYIFRIGNDQSATMFIQADTRQRTVLNANLKKPLVVHGIKADDKNSIRAADMYARGAGPIYVIDIIYQNHKVIYQLPMVDSAKADRSSAQPVTNAVVGSVLNLVNLKNAFGF